MFSQFNRTSRPSSANSKQITLGPPSAIMPPGLNVKSAMNQIATNNNASTSMSVQRSNGPLNHPIPASVVEKEYIHNLQQQVYFLEMQGKLLRERLSTPGPRVKSRSVEANPSIDRNLDAAAPLAEHIDQLRQKYTDQENAFKESKKELQQAFDNLKGRYAELEEENKALKQKCDTLPEQIKEARKSIAEENVKISNECEKLKQELGDTKLIIQNKDGEISTNEKTIKDLREAIARLEQEKKKIEHDLREAQRGFCSPQRAQARELELSKALLEASDYKKQLQQAQEDLHDMETRENTAKDEKWKTEKELADIQSQLRELQRTNDGLRTEIGSHNNTITTLRREGDQKNIQIQTLKATLESVQEELRIAKNDAAAVSTVTRRLNEAETTKNEALTESEEKSKEISLLKGEKEDLYKRIDDLNLIIDGLREQQIVLGEETAMSISSKKVAEVKVRDLDRRVNDLTTKLATKERELTKAKAEIDVLTAELGVFGEFSSMKEYFDEITRLRNTNEKLGETIKKLTEKFIYLRKASKAYSDIGGDDIIIGNMEANRETPSPVMTKNNENKKTENSSINFENKSNNFNESKNIENNDQNPKSLSMASMKNSYKNLSLNESYTESNASSPFKNTVIQSNFKLN